MQVAILGAGFSGLATTYHLFSRLPTADITVYDVRGIGGGASGVAAGLLHPFGGAHAKLNRLGREGYEATKKLLMVAEQAVGKPVVGSKGMLRVAVSDAQKEDFARTALEYPDVEWLDAAQCKELIPHLAPEPGIFISSGLTIHSNLYLQSLWQACESMGAKFEQRKVGALQELKHFDLIIVALGAGTTSLPELTHLPLKPIKGQILELEWPTDTPPLPFGINSKSYLVMSPNNLSCIAGATFERQFTSSQPDIERAKEEILRKTADFSPLLKEANILECRAGIRVSTPDHLPLIQQVSKNCWVITGMGSKGLLYHALFAEKLIEEIMTAFYSSISDE